MNEKLDYVKEQVNKVINEFGTMKHKEYKEKNKKMNSLINLKN